VPLRDLDGDGVLKKAGLSRCALILWPTNFRRIHRAFVVPHDLCAFVPSSFQASSYSSFATVSRARPFFVPLFFKFHSLPSTALPQEKHFTPGCRERWTGHPYSWPFNSITSHQSSSRALLRSCDRLILCLQCSRHRNSGPVSRLALK